MCFITQRENGKRMEYLSYKGNKLVVTSKIDKAERLDTFEQARKLTRDWKFGSNFIPFELDDTYDMKNTSIEQKTDFVFEQDEFDWKQIVDAFDVLKALFEQRDEYIKYLKVKLSGIDALIDLLEHKTEEDSMNNIDTPMEIAIARDELLGEYRVKRREIKNEITKASKLTEDGIRNGDLQDVYNFHNNPVYANKTLVNIDDIIQKKADEIKNNTYKILNKDEIA